MHKKWSLNIGKFSGINVFIHWTFLILIGWIFLMHFRMGHGFSEGLSGTLFILALFACVLLHEFGHSLTAKRFGVQTKDITIYPIGGIANLESMPTKPSQELQIALAGPAINIFIAGVLWIYLKSTGQTPELSAIYNIKLSGDSFIPNLMYANIILAVFNLIPAFPMDGGRVLRSLLAMKIEPVKATSIAAKAGQFLAIIFVFIGFFFNFWLVFIGLFIFLGAGAEFKVEEIKKALQGVRATNVMMSKFTVLHPENTLQKASHYLLNSREKSFLVLDNDNVVGILDYMNIVDGLHEGKINQKVEAFMQKDFHSFENDEYLTDRINLIQQENQSLFPVMLEDKLVGVISLDNINKWIQAKPYAFNH